VWNVFLVIFCNAGLVDMNHISLSFSWKVLFLHKDWRMALLVIVFLIGSFSLFKLEL
jgi:hypothetical protein